MKVEVVTNEKQLQDAFSVRRKVFVEEQNVPPEQELDQFDEIATHFVVYDDTLPIGYGRLRELENAGKVERICILPEYRKQGAGKTLMRAIIHFAKEKGFTAIKLNAQIQAIPFYKSLGFTVTSGEFMDAGIPHKSMELNL